MDELDVGGKKYISSKRASEITAYAKDYIGQLARAGKVPGTRFGRAWYVEEAAILRHAGKALDVPTIEHDAAVSATGSEAVKLQPALPQKPLLSPHMIAPIAMPKTWSSIRYIEDTEELFPKIVERTPEQAIIEQVNTDFIPPATPVVAAAREEMLKKSRVAALVDGIRPSSPILRVAKFAKPTPRIVPTPQIEGLVPKKNVPETSGKSIPRVTQEIAQPRIPMRVNAPIISPLPRISPLHVGVHWSAGTFAALLVFFSGSVATFTILKILGTPPKVLTATSYVGISPVLESIQDARIFDAGLYALKDFYQTLEMSFGAFIVLASEFIVSLF